MKVLITGHSSGFGLALAKQFKDSGSQVYGISRSLAGTEVCDRESECDFGDIEKSSEKIIRFVDTLPDLDYVFLNAGTLGTLGTAKSLPVERLQESININVMSHKVLLDAILNRTNMKCNNIVAISSGAALAPKYGWVEYCVSKGALKMLLEIYSVENPQTKFVSIAPGLIKTKMQDKIFQTSAEEIPSVERFHGLYDSMDSAECVANRFIEFLDNIQHMKSGEYVDIRKYTTPITLDIYRSTIQKEEGGTLGIDFDGVLHDCKEGFLDGTLYGAPLPGALDAIRLLSEKYDIAIYSVRSRSDRPLIDGKNGTQQIWEWLRENGIDECVTNVASEKPRAAFYIDDKAIEFRDWEECINKLKERDV